jgi:gluconate 2-dehydrogenase subunit 3-like protein
VANRASRETERGGGGLVSPGSDTSHAIPTDVADKARVFFRAMKELTILGYYTSQPGATKELRYVQVPGRYDGCVPFAKIGREWAT